MIVDYFRLLQQSPRVLILGLSYAFFSSFGQTFFISLSVPHILQEFGYSNAQWGTLYSGVNVLSALCLPVLGAKLDRTPLQLFTTRVIIGLCLATALMAFGNNLVLLALALGGLRLTGQGLLSLMATATMARLFDRQRGKALSIATMGFPLGESLLPPLTILLIDGAGWRVTWGVAAALTLLIVLPLTRSLSRGLQTTPDHGPNHTTSSDDHWNRRRVLGHWRFYTVLPTYISPGFFATGLILYQFSLADEKGWSHAYMAGSFVSFGLSRMVFAFLIGPLIDRFTARSLFSLQLLPLATGMALMSVSNHSMIPFLYNGLIGISLGIGSSTSSALWAELYGTKHLGAIKSLMSTIGIFFTALSPILVGSLIDSGILFANQLMAYAIVVLAFGILSAVGCRLGRSAKSIPPVE